MRSGDMNLSKLYLCLGLGLSLLSACQETPAPQVPSGRDVLQANAERGEASKLDFSQFSAAQRFALELKTLNVAELQQIVAQAKDQKLKADEDLSAMRLLFQALVTSEAKKQSLQVNFMMSEGPVEDGIFVFNVESPIKSVLSMQMFDEEGYELAAENKLHIEKGTNYKALNVKSLNSGTYLFRLKNEFGEELYRQVEVSN